MAYEKSAVQFAEERCVRLKEERDAYYAKHGKRKTPQAKPLTLTPQQAYAQTASAKACARIQELQKDIATDDLIAKARKKAGRP